MIVLPVMASCHPGKSTDRCRSRPRQPSMLMRAPAHREITMAMAQPVILATLSDRRWVIPVHGHRRAADGGPRFHHREHRAAVGQRALGFPDSDRQWVVTGTFEAAVRGMVDRVRLAELMTRGWRPRGDRRGPARGGSCCPGAHDLGAMFAEYDGHGFHSSNLCRSTATAASTGSTSPTSSHPSRQAEHPHEVDRPAAPGHSR
jgi:hypothetical protein